MGVRLANSNTQDMSRQAVTKHLDILQAAGLVTVHREGRYKLHYSRVDPLREIYRWAQERITSAGH